MDLPSRREVARRAVVALGEARPVLVTGADGSGRSRVLQTISSALGRHGRTTHTVAGRDAAEGIPLAPVAPVLAALGLDAAEPLAVYGRLPALMRSTGSALLVDDVDRADHATCVLTLQCVRAGAGVVVTSGADLPRTLLDSVTSGDWVRLHLPPLSVEETATLAEHRIGAPLDVPSLARLVRAGAGAPRQVVELLAAGGAGATEGPHGVALGPDLLTEPLREQVDRRLRGLPPPVVGLVERACTVGRLPEELCAAEEVDLAVEAGLLLVREEDGAGIVWPADDLLVAAVRERLGSLAVRRTLDRVAADLDARPPRSAAGRAFRAVVEVRRGGSVDAVSATQAAESALRHHRPAEAVLLLDATATPRDSEDLLLRGRARSAAGDLRGARRDLEDAAAGARGDLLVRVGHELGVLHAVRCEDPATAVTVVADIAERLGPQLAAPLRADLVKWRLMAGQPADPAVLSEDARRAGELADRIGLAVIGAMVASLDGPLPQAFRIVEENRGDAEESAVPHAGELLDLSRYLATAFSGDLCRAEQEAIAATEVAVRIEHPAVGMWEYARAELGLHTGRTAESCRIARRSVGHLAWHDFTGLRPSARALHAALEARCGRLEAALAIASDLPSAAREDVKVDLHLTRVEAATAIAGDGREEAAALLIRVAERACAEAHAHLGLLAHDEAFLIARDRATRERAAARLRDGAARSVLFAALADRAQADLADDPHELEQAATRLHDLGLIGRAAAAYEDAADRHRRRGRRDTATRLYARSQQVRGEATRLWPEPSPLDVLSAREREIALLAARSRSRDVATRLGLSTRTVDNHLARIFAKLDVAGRAELAALLGEHDAAE